MTADSRYLPALRAFRLPGAILLLLLPLFALPRDGSAVQEKPPGGRCMECHSSPDVQTGRPQVDPGQIDSSAHRGLACLDCHRDVAALPHPIRPLRVDCLGCHAGGVDRTGLSIDNWRDSVHGRAVAAGKAGAAACTDCHGRHDILGQDNPRSTVCRRNIPVTCARCHENNQVVLKHDIHSERPYQEYQQSVHGRALYQDGLLQVAAVCTDCHGVHDIQAAGDTLPLASQPATCGKCHIAIFETYIQSIHGSLRVVKGDLSSPSCVDCHGEHGIQPPQNVLAPTYSANIPNTCARCHADKVRMARYNIATDRLATYQQSFHGVAQGLGELNAANCASCHGYHDILPSSDPRSSTNAANMIATCGKCHPNASANFIKGNIHVNPRSRSAGAVYYLRTGMVWLVYVVLALLAFWMGADLTRRRRRSRG
jgi:hypothetical protein